MLRSRNTNMEHRYQKYKYANKPISKKDTVEIHGFFQTIKILLKINAKRHTHLQTPIYLTVQPMYHKNVHHHYHPKKRPQTEKTSNRKKSKNDSHSRKLGNQQNASKLQIGCCPFTGLQFLSPNKTNSKRFHILPEQL